MKRLTDIGFRKVGEWKILSGGIIPNLTDVSQHIIGVKYMPIDFMKSAYRASVSEIQKLANNMRMLEERTMTKLNRRLLKSGRNIWDTFSEHNFAVKLISYHNQNVQISYEPDEGLRRPSDFKIVLGGLTYWIQMKRLSNLERENIGINNRSNKWKKPRKTITRKNRWKSSSGNLRTSSGRILTPRNISILFWD